MDLNETHVNLKLNPDCRILVIRKDRIGDLVCTTPMLEALKKKYPLADVRVLTSEYNYDVLIDNPDVNKVYVYQKTKYVPGILNRLKKILTRLKLIKELKRWNPALIVLAAAPDKHGLNFARQINSKKVLGWEVLGNSDQPDFLLRLRKDSYMHEVQFTLELLKPLEIKNESIPLKIFYDQKIVTEILRALPPAKKRIAIQISAKPRRRWGVENYIKLVNEILGKYLEVQVLLFWSPGKRDHPTYPGDDEDSEYLIQTVNSSRLIPIKTLRPRDLINGLQLCDLFVGNDGGAMHIACALKKPIIALFECRPEKLNRWYPWQVQHSIIHSGDPLNPEVKNISVDQVLEVLSSYDM